MDVCNARVGSNSVTFSCSLESGHEGPHYAIENQASVNARSRWDLAQAHSRSDLGRFQGMAQTTAERYTSNPTSVPQTNAVLRADAQDARHRSEDNRRAEQANLADLRHEIHGDRVEQVDGLDVLYQDQYIVLKGLPDGRYLVEKPDGTMGESLSPTWLDITEDEDAEDSLAVHLTEDSVPTKQRVGDQPLPVANTWIDSYEEAIKDFRARREIGIGRYGAALQPFNGRNTVLDAYEEAMDLTVYLRTLLTMQQASRRLLEDEVAKVLEPFISQMGGMTPGNSTSKMYAAEQARLVVDRVLDAVTGRV